MIMVMMIIIIAGNLSNSSWQGAEKIWIYWNFKHSPIKNFCGVEFDQVVKGDNYDFRISDKI